MDKIGIYTGTADGNDEFTEGDPGTGTPATEVDGGWLNGVQRELVKVIEQMGLTLDQGDDTLLWQAVQKIYGKTHAGNPQGNVAADVLRERCWDTSVSPPALYVATAADGTTGGTTWKRFPDMATDAEAQAFTADKFIDGAKLATAFQGGNQSLVQSGYQILPGGMIVQWGKSDLAGNNASIGSASVIGNILLPVTFPNAAFSATVNSLAAGATGGEATENKVGVESLSTTQLSVNATRISGSFSGGEIHPVIWMAVGH